VNDLDCSPVFCRTMNEIGPDRKVTATIEVLNAKME